MKKHIILLLIVGGLIATHGMGVADKTCPPLKPPPDPNADTWSFEEYKERQRALRCRENKGGYTGFLRRPGTVTSIVLTFHQMPTKAETALILQKTEERGLKKTRVLTDFKWLLQWDKPKDVIIAEVICVNLIEVLSLKDCNPNYFLPSSTKNRSSTPIFPIYQNKKSCDIAPDHQTYWAQHQIGGDLLREELHKKNSKSYPIIYVFDSYENKGGIIHALAVQNLIADDGPHAVLLKEGIRNIEIKGIYGDSLYSQHLKSFKTAGNDYQFNPQVYQTVIRKSKNLDSIIVGSLAPDGYRSDFSQANEEVTIMAPSDNSIITKDLVGRLRQFGGTSGAAPLVTGSLAAFNYMSDYRPTAKLAKILLRNTAIPTRYSNNKPQIRKGAESPKASSGSIQ